MDFEAVRFNTMPQQDTLTPMPAVKETSAKAAEKTSVNIGEEGKTAVTVKTKSEDDKQYTEEAGAKKLLDKAIEDANNKLKYSGRTLSYSYHEESKRVSVKVIDTQSKEVIREIPPEKELDAYAKILEMSGLILDQKS